jgi:hypothetical protein
VTERADRDETVSEAQIAVHWREEDYYHPPATFIAKANATDPAIVERYGEKYFPECFKEYADLLSWDHYWHTTLDTGTPPLVRRRSPEHSPRRHVLVLRRHRVDHRALLHRLRAARAGNHQRDVRGRAHLPGSRASLADRRATRGEHLPHRAHDDPHAAQARAGGAHEVPVPLQAHDHGRRADRTGRVALVSQRRRQGPSGHRRYLVANRERRVSGQHAAADEARQLRSRGPRGLPGDLRRGGSRGRGRKRPGRQHLHP